MDTKKIALTVLFVFLLGLMPYIVSAAWWNESYVYKREINVTDLSGDLVNIYINTSELYNQSKMRSDCGDIMFTDENGTSLYSWNENSSCYISGEDNTTFWINISDVSAGSLYMYYGNEESESYFDGKRTFALFDDFSSALNTTIWDPSGTYSVSNSILKIGDTSSGGTGSVYSRSSFGNNSIVKYRLKFTSSGTPLNIGAGFNTGDYRTMFILDSDGESHAVYDSSTYYKTSRILGLQTTFHTATIYWNNTYSFFVDETLSRSHTEGFHTEDMQARMWVMDYSPNPQNEVDWVFAGDLTSVDSSYTIGAEEEAPSTNIIAHTTSPSVICPNTDINFNMTATDSDNATFTGYVQFYVNGTETGATQSQLMNNNTNTLIGTLSHTSFEASATVIAEYWAGDSEKSNHSTITVQACRPNMPTLVSPEIDTFTSGEAINLTVTITDDYTNTMNVSFIIMEVGSDSWPCNFTDQANNTNVTCEFTPLLETVYSWNASVWNINGQNISTTWNFTVDRTIPVITANFTNMSIFYTADSGNITGQFNMSDTWLYSYNLSMDGATVSNETSMSTDLLVYNLSEAISSYNTVGEHNISLRVCDGHTNTELADQWQQNIGLLGLTFKEETTDKKGKTQEKWFRIRPANTDLFDKITTEKQRDRYTFTYEKSWMGNIFGKEDSYTFIVESSDYIDIIKREGSPYNAWLVIPTIGTTGRWIDFNLKDAPNTNYFVKRISPTTVEVTISNVSQELSQLEFESTGELNCITEYYDFYVYNYSTSYTTPVIETSEQTFTLNITKDSSYITNANATLNWNGTSYNSTMTDGTDYFLFTKTLDMPSVDANTNITLNWTYTLEGIDENTTNTTSDETQLIYNLDIDDCSTYTVQALNFTLVEEANNELINGTMGFTFRLSQENTNINYSKSVTDNNTVQFCIPNNDTNFSSEMQVEYEAGSYTPNSYFAYDLTINNASQDIPLYLVNGTTVVTFTVLDENGRTIEDAYIKVKKYDVGTDTYKTVEVLKTDSQGEALGNIVLQTVWYEFVVEYEGAVVLSDGPTKINSLTRTFRVTLLTDFYQQFTDATTGIVRSLTYTDETGNFRFMWSDPDGDFHYGCLKVTKMDMAGETLINETCTASTSGTILINVNSSGPVNGTYTAVGYILFDDKTVLDTLVKVWGSLSETFGDEGLFFGFIIIITLVMVGLFAPKLAVIFGVIGITLVSILGFFNLNPQWIVGLILAAGLTIYRMRDN